MKSAVRGLKREKNGNTWENSSVKTVIWMYLSPVRTCDPWAVHSAKTFEQNMGGTATTTPIQKEILSVLKETGGIEKPELLKRLKEELTMPQLEREFATLRHMEKARAEKRGDRVVLVCW